MDDANDNISLQVEAVVGGADPMTVLEISLLGPIQVSLGEKHLETDLAHKSLALLAYLACEGEVPQQRDTLAGLLWPEQPNAAARLSLRQALFGLRQALPPDTLLSTRQTIQLNPAADFRLDVATFVTELTACQNHPHSERRTCPACLARLATVVGLYRGDFMGQFILADCAAFEEWMLLKREWLRHETLEALAELALAAQVGGDYETAYRYAWRQIELDPLREAAYRQLMRSLAGQGRRSEALAQYQTCRELLAAELGVEPAAETTALAAQLREGDGDEGVVLPARSKESPLPVTDNLPAQLTPLVGRGTELSELARFLGNPETRLVTIVGPGGIGKTRLALAVAVEQRDQFPDGAYFVSLAGLDAAEAIPTAIAQALKFTFYEGETPLDQLAAYLRQKTVLLLMDNFEHVRAGVGDIIRLLQAAPKLKVLATSRARLNVQSEQLFPLDGLDFPADPVSAPPSSAEQLFVQAARQVRPDFQVTAENGPAIARICRLVQGMPLGILLAAAWVEILSPVEIVIQLGGEETGQTLDFLQTDWQDVTERQRSLRAVFDHSWRLLTDEERSAFRQMSVFRGGFTIEAAEKVSGASLQTLLALVNKSLLRRVQRGRFEMHELLRQFGVEKLGQETTAVRDRHCAYYAAFLRARNEGLKGARQQAALAELETDSQNLRAAWQWAVDQHHLPQLSQAVDGLAQFYQWQGRYQEGEALYRRAIERLTTASTPAGLRVLLRVSVWQASFSSQLQPADAVTQLFQQCQAQLERIPLGQDEQQAECAFLYMAMAKHLSESDYDEARRIAEQGLALYKVLEDRWAIAQTLQILGYIYSLGGRYQEATQWLEEALTIQRVLGDRRGLARSLRILGLTRRYQGHLAQAEQLHREALVINRELDDRHGLAEILKTMGATLAVAGNLSECLLLLEESLSLYTTLGTHLFAVSVQELLGRYKLLAGQYGPARSLLQEALPLAQMTNNFILADTFWSRGMLALVEEDFHAAHSFCQQGIALFRQIKQTALVGACLAIQGYAARSLGQPRQAAGYLAEALQCGLDVESVISTYYSLPAIALLLVDQENVEIAVELYAPATRFPLVRNSQWFEDVAGRHIAAAAKALPPEVVAAAQARGQARDLWQTVEEILTAPAQFGLA